MSRAFTKEDDAGDDLPERPIPPGPNYMTPRGMELLKAAGRELAEKKKNAIAEGGDVRPFDRDLRYLEARIDSAIVVPHGSGDEVRFGASVTIESEGEGLSFQIVGEDEARTDSKFISWSAPIVSAILGAKPGQIVDWNGPAGKKQIKIISVSYPD